MYLQNIYAFLKGELQIRHDPVSKPNVYLHGDNGLSNPALEFQAETRIAGLGCEGLMAHL